MEKATVTEDVVLKATKAGKVYVKVTVTKDGVSAEDYITVRVVDKRTDVSTVAFSDPADKPIEIYAGKSYKINATVTSGTGKYTVADLTWESSDTGVIRVDKSGNIYGVSTGSAEVTATLPNGNAASTIVTAVEVPEAPRSVHLRKASKNWISTVQRQASISTCSLYWISRMLRLV